MRDDIFFRIAVVWVSYPLKQGLKHKLKEEIMIKYIRLSQLSIKTRIETLYQD